MNSRKNKAKKVVITCGLALMFGLIGLPAPKNPNANPIYTPTAIETVMDAFSPMTAYAASTFSEYWYQDGSGAWHIKDGNGNMVTNAWLCDDAVASNGQNVWYLIDGSGNMVSAGLVQDGTGNYYSLETNHNGYYGMLRYQSGNYDGINLDLESSHSGSFAAIKNQDGIEGLKAKYGLTTVNISNSNCVYTSSFRSSGNSNNSPSSSNQSNYSNTSDLNRESNNNPTNTTQKSNKLKYAGTGKGAQSAADFEGGAWTVSEEEAEWIREGFKAN